MLFDERGAPRIVDLGLAKHLDSKSIGLSKTGELHGTAGYMPREQMHDAKFVRIGPVDVVCTHMPPRIPWYTYDVKGKRFEPGSVGLIGYIQDHEPRFALFGHVHNPLVPRGSIHRTELVNVGHFQAHGRGFTFEVPEGGGDG